MLSLIIAILFILLYVEIVLRKSIISPVTVMLLAFIFSIVIMKVNETNWDLSLSGKFYLYVITAMISFFLGTVIVRIINLFSRNPIIEDKSASFLYYPGRIMLIISVLTFIGYFFLRTNGFSNTGSINDLLRSIYDDVSGGTSGNFVMNQLLMVNIVIAKISFFEICRRLYLNNQKQVKIHLLLPILIFLLIVAFTTDRNILLRFFIYALSIWAMFILNLKDSNFLKKILMIIRKGSIYVAIALIIFYFFGLTKNYTSNLTRVIGLYGGSGLYNFNFYLENAENFELGYGQYTFSNILAILDSIFNFRNGNSILANSQLFEFITFKSSTGFIYASNIYSSLRLYVADFGFYGVVMIPGIMGIFFESLYSRVKKYKFGLTWIVYGNFIYGVVYLPIQEQFFQRMHLGTLYEIFWLLLIYYLIYGKRGLANFKFVY